MWKKIVTGTVHCYLGSNAQYRELSTNKRKKNSILTKFSINWAKLDTNVHRNVYNWLRKVSILIKQRWQCIIWYDVSRFCLHCNNESSEIIRRVTKRFQTIRCLKICVEKNIIYYVSFVYFQSNVFSLQLKRLTALSHTLF